CTRGGMVIVGGMVAAGGMVIPGAAGERTGDGTGHARLAPALAVPVSAPAPSRAPAMAGKRRTEWVLSMAPSPEECRGTGHARGNRRCLRSYDARPGREGVLRYPGADRLLADPVPVRRVAHVCPLEALDLYEDGSPFDRVAGTVQLVPVEPAPAVIRR